jgi:hypothetical protein
MVSGAISGIGVKVLKKYNGEWFSAGAMKQGGVTTTFIERPTIGIG